jgi:hypothetical protein
LSIVVEANGKVTQAKALSGPEELFPAALASVKMWHYEIPASAPITMTVEIGYGVPKECPGPISDMGEVEGNGRLFDKNGKLVAVVDDSDYPIRPIRSKNEWWVSRGRWFYRLLSNVMATSKRFTLSSHCRPGSTRLPSIWCVRGNSRAAKMNRYAATEISKPI